MIHLIEDEKLSAWFPLEKKYRKLSLNEFNQYAEISEEQFKTYEGKKDELSNLILMHKNSDFLKDKHKANLSV